MKFAHKQLIAAGLLAGLGFAASAQAPAAAAGAAPAPSREGRHNFNPAKMQEHFARHQAELKQKLQITAVQEGAWNSFSSAIKPAPRPQRMDRAAFAALSTPDRIDHMRALRGQRIAEMDRRADATKAFYATLSAEQKKVFDAQSFRHGGRGGHGGHPMHKG